MKHIIVDKNGIQYHGDAIDYIFSKEDYEGYVEFLNATPNLGGNSERVPFRVVEAVGGEVSGE